MTSILDRGSLEQSPLADLHTIASELSIDGYRRLRKAELIDAILKRQGGEAEAPARDEELAVTDDGEEAPARRRRGRRGGRGRGAARPEAGEEAAEAGEEPSEADEGSEQEGVQEIERQLRRAGDELVEGVVELLPNGSGFVRVNAPEPSDDDVYVSAAQVKRCELVSGDKITGPRRPPRRSERFASLLRVDTINGRPADELADTARFDDLATAFPSEALVADPGDEELKTVLERCPIGRGSRVTIAGAPQSGKSELLRRFAGALASQDGLQVWLVLAGVRPEEISAWREGPLEPAAAVSLAASADSQAHILEGVIEQARRLAARGSDCVVLIDTLAGIAPHAARRALAGARNIVDGASLTVIATAAEPLGGETTVIALDRALAREGRFPAIDPEASWTMRPELLAPAAE